MIGRKVAFGAAILGLSHIISRALDLLATIIVVRYISPADFGLVALALSIYYIVMSLSEFPISEALVQREKIFREDLDTAFTLSIIRGGGVCLVLLALAYIYKYVDYFAYQDVSPILIAFSILPILTGLKSPSLVNFDRNIQFGPEAIINITAKTFSFLVSVVIAIYTMSYWSLIFGRIISEVIILCLSYYLSPYRPRVCFRSFKVIMSFVGWLSLGRAIHTINLQSDKIFLSVIIGAEALGVYALGGDLASMATYALAVPLLKTLFAGFSHIHNDNVDQTSKFRLANSYLTAQQVLAAIILPFGFGLAVTAEPVTKILLGDEWLGVVPVLNWLAPVIALQILIYPIQAAASAIGETRKIFNREVVSLMLRLPITIYCAYQYGLIGAVMARSVVGIIIVIINFHIGKEILGVSVWRQISNCWRSLISCGVMVFYIEVFGQYFYQGETHIIALFAIVSSGALAYILANLLLWWFVGRPSGPEKMLFTSTYKIISTYKK